MNPNEVHKVSDVFSAEDLESIASLLADATPIPDSTPNIELGRELLTNDSTEISGELISKLTNLVNSLTNRTLTLRDHRLSVFTYSNKYGAPNLRPHFDGDNNELIMDYQLSSNTRWPLGVNTSVYDLEDNSALLFNPNTNVHWRPHKTFKDNEYVSMIFFRFYDENSQTDYSHLPHHPDDPTFKESREYRESFSLDGI